MRHLPHRFIPRTAAALVVGSLMLASPPAATPASAHGSDVAWAWFGGWALLSLLSIATAPRYAYPAPVVYGYPPPVAPAYYYPPAYPVAPAGALRADPTSPIYQTEDGRACRTYQATVASGAVIQGTACQGPDGVWRVN